MSTKVTVSCETQDELLTVLMRLRDIAEKVITPEPKGKYIKAYVHIGYKRKRKPDIDKAGQKRYNDSDEAIAIMDVESEYPIP